MATAFSIRAVSGEQLSLEQRQRRVWWAADIHSESGHNFSAEIVGNELVICPKSREEADWYASLAENERNLVFDAAAQHFRKYSPEPNGMKVAAIGVIENPKPVGDSDRHLAYIKFNIRNCSSQHIKNCAEANIMGTLDRDLQRDNEMPIRADGKPSRQMVEEWHVIGGKEGKDGIFAVGPCGFCLDEMAEHSTENTLLYIHSLHEPSVVPEIVENINSLTDMKPGQILKTTVAHFNQKRFVTLDEAEITSQKKALQEIIYDLTAMYKGDERPAFLSYDSSLRHSMGIAAIKDAHAKNGEVDSQKMAAFFYEQTLMTLYPRLLQSGAAKEEEAVRQWVHQNIDMLRINVFGMADGSFEYGKECRSTADKAMPNASNATISAAVDLLPGNPLKRLYSYTFDPKNIEEGVMRTPSKDELERSYKRSEHTVENEMKVTVFAPSPKKKRAIHRYFSLDDLYPSRFSGVKMPHGGIDFDTENKAEFRHSQGLKPGLWRMGKRNQSEPTDSITRP